MSKWQPIETAPRDGTVVDLWYRGERITDYRWVQLSETNGFFECVESGYTCVRDATHWQLPPELPND
jgi:hypothetical protein